MVRKRHEALTPATVWLHPRNGARKPGTKRDTCYASIYMKYPEKANGEAESRSVIVRGLAGVGGGEGLLMSTGLLSGIRETFCCDDCMDL